MKVSPINIKRQEFNKSLRGYDTEEVHAFLEKLADDFDELQKENETIKEELENANVHLAEFRRIEKNLQDTLLKAQDSSAKAIESTKKQTNLMVKEAEIKANQILEKARENADEIRDAVIKLREERDLIISKLKAMVDSQAHLFELKVREAGEEAPEMKKPEQLKKVKIDVDDIVNKIL
ncbi:MAG TPA: DivIVA domain-containing protein [Ignavibacteriaceae bacterium]|nr:DivIVA domain-containing protein [Ignavibacteriaceae bacterium]